MANGLKVAKSILALTAIAFITASLTGCGCERQAVVDCVGATPVVCQDTRTDNDGDQCCKWFNKIISCHESESCSCDQERSEPDGKNNVQAYLNHLRSLMVFCPLAGVTPETYCA
mmetsp:Transcript_20518/g.33997  ORF Transcript_20518/g.33997 Transcript_20518/m.33997 type:complete len:115 (+) Transcript_20518:82-426(+)